VLDLPAVADAAALIERLAAIARDHDVLRMKGFAEVSGKPMRLLVQGVGARFSHQFDRPWQSGETRLGRLVVIGEKGVDKAAISSALLA
jgi:cobalamin biosynthesis protein CobW